MAYLEVQLTPKLHRVYELQSGESTIGRAPQCDVQFLSRAVSRRHARLELDEAGEAVISDLGTKNGIRVNSLRVMGAAPLRDGDKIQVGDVNFVFRAGGGEAIPAGEVVDLRGRQVTNEDLTRVQQEAASSWRFAASEAATSAFQSLVARVRLETLFDFDEETQLKLQIALKEALDNARIHGCAGDPAGVIEVAFHDDPEEFRISVSDPGKGFDVNSLLAKLDEVEDALAAVRERHRLGPGQGLRIMLNCVDRLQFERGGALLHLAKFKAGGELFVISDSAEQEPADPNEPTDLDLLPDLGGGA